MKLRRYPSFDSMRALWVFPFVVGFFNVACGGDSPSDGGAPPSAGAATAITTGDGFACALRKDGAVFCWGNNAHGQLGDGTTTARYTPARVAGLAKVVELDAGSSSVCARVETGGVVCWGENDAGQVGDGTKEDRTKPTEVAGLTGATQLAVGSRHTCALRSDGSAWCWGATNVLQFGRTGAADSTKPSRMNVPDTVVEIRTSTVNTCARTSKGDVYCAGPNWGILLDAVEVGKVPFDPLKVALPTDVAEIALGNRHACLRTTSGTVSCWGSNTNGALGIGASDESVHGVTPVPGLTDVVQLTTARGSTDASLVLGGGSTCARTKSGAVSCWGRNMQGSLGDGTSTTRTSPVAVVGLADAASVSVGASVLMDPHGTPACVLRATGAVVCWGPPINRAAAPGETGYLEPRPIDLAAMAAD